MHWLLFGCCGLALVNLSVSSTIQITQKPRFYGVKMNRKVVIYCMSSNGNQPAQVEWYKAPEYNTAPGWRVRVQVKAKRVSMRNKGAPNTASISLWNLVTEDSGVYFCKINNIWGPGTELQVIRPTNLEVAVRRSKMKDALILVQALLLTLCVVAPLLCKQTLMKKEDAIYEEPEHDHIYEGLEIEHCGGGLYEDISVYAQPEADVPWEE